MKRDPRCNFTIQQEREIINLYEKGSCLRQVGEKFDVNSSRICRILKANKIRRRSHSEGTRLLHKHLKVDPPNDFPWHLYGKFSKLLSVFLLTDGYMKKGGGIMLICTDEILQRYFLTLVKEAYGLAPTISAFMKKGKETIVHSKSVSANLLKSSPTYNTYPRNISKQDYFQKPQPSLTFLENEEINVLKETVRIAMSTDGTVNVDFPHNSIYPKLEFSCAHPILLHQWKRIFEKIGIKSFFIKSNVTWSKLRGLGIKELRSIRRFVEIGGFINGVKITGKSKYYKGIPKNSLLKLIINLHDKSFQFPHTFVTTHKNYILLNIMMKNEKYMGTAEC